jgi:hypothetical protein
MTESIQKDEQTLEEALNPQEADFFDTVASEIVNSEENYSSTTDDEEDEEGEEDASPETKSKTQAEQSHRPQRKESRTNERVRQLVERAKISEDKYQASQERLTFSNEKIAMLEKSLSDYEQVIKEFEQFRDSFLAGNATNQPTSKSGAVSSANQSLTEAQVLKLWEDKKKQESDAVARSETAKRKADEVNALKAMWTPHVKRINDDKFPAEQREFMTNFVKEIDNKPNREQLLKIVGKYQYAPEILFGLYKKPGFEGQSLAEQIEDAIKLNNKIIQQKSKVTESKSTNNGQSSGAVKSSGKAKNYAEYLARKHGRS